MKSKRRVISGSILIALLGTLAACASVEGDYEEPRYTVLEAHEDEAIEIREYEPMVIAEVTVDGDRGEAGNKAFRILAGYIFGDNRAKEEIEMTAPVTHEPREQKSIKIEMTAPVTQEPLDAAQQTWDVAFIMPARFTLETLPEAMDERIRFREVAPHRAAAITFSGNWDRKRFEEKRAQLEQFLQENGYDYDVYQYAFYNSPMTPSFMRRNEVLYRIEPLRNES